VHRPFDRLRAGFTLAAAAALVLTAGACATPPAEKSAAGTADATAKAGPGPQSGTGGEKAEGKKLSWLERLSQYHREPKEKPWAYGDVRPGRGVLSNDDDGFVLYRQGEGEGDSSDPDKPTKLKR
jgi:hypothetical protein